MADQWQPNLGSISWLGMRSWHSHWYYVVLVDRSRTCLSSEIPNQRLTKRCRYLQPSVGLRSGTPIKDLGGGLKELKGIATPEEGQQCQQTWTPDISQRLSHKPKTIHGLTWDPWHICNRELSCLATVREAMSNSVETWCSKEGECSRVVLSKRQRGEGSWVVGQEGGSTFGT